MQIISACDCLQLQIAFSRTPLARNSSNYTEWLLGLPPPAQLCLSETFTFGAEIFYLGVESAFRKYEQHCLRSVSGHAVGAELCCLSLQVDSSGDKILLFVPTALEPFLSAGLSPGLMLLPWAGDAVPLCRDPCMRFRLWQFADDSSEPEKPELYVRRHCSQHEHLAYGARRSHQFPLAMVC